ncbi:MAG: hypothetical protein AAB728_05815 [Patescibacteria group bacterium]
MASKLSSKPDATPFLIGNMFAAAILLLATVVSAVDMVKAHVFSDGFVFGTSGGSLSVIAFVLSFIFFYKYLKRTLGFGCCCK